MLNKHRTRVITENKWGDKDMKESLNSNSLHLSLVMQAEKEKAAKNKKKDGKGQKRDGKANQENGQNGNGQNGNAKKAKKELHCSHCGPNAGHTDLHCYHDPNTEAAKAKIAENRKNPEMSKHFKQLDHALKKRANPSVV